MGACIQIQGTGCPHWMWQGVDTHLWGQQMKVATYETICIPSISVQKAYGNLCQSKRVGMLNLRPGRVVLVSEWQEVISAFGPEL